MAGITFKQNNNSLSFNAPKEVIKAVEEVYVGNTAPTDDNYKVWVKPEGEVTEVASKKYVDDAISNLDFEDIDLEGYATESYVDEAISKIELIPGEPGQPGEPGYTPIKGVDYFDGEPGKDGYTPIKGVDYFDGEPGAPGKDGEDYVLTAADKQEIANLVSSSFVDGEGVEY